jgi:hypothetical protein
MVMTPLSTPIQHGAQALPGIAQLDISGEYQLAGDQNVEDDPDHAVNGRGQPGMQRRAEAKEANADGRAGHQAQNRLEDAPQAVVDCRVRQGGDDDHEAQPDRKLHRRGIHAQQKRINQQLLQRKPDRIRGASHPPMLDLRVGEKKQRQKRPGQRAVVLVVDMQAGRHEHHGEGKGAQTMVNAHQPGG